MNTRHLLTKGYFVEELPPPFHTAVLARHHRTLQSHLAGLSKEDREKVNETLPVLYSTPKMGITYSGEIQRALGTPLFSGLMRQWTKRSIMSVTLFGLHFDLIVNKIRLEHMKGIQQKELFKLCNDFGYLKKAFKEFNR